jgi:hypothetical protein
MWVCGFCEIDVFSNVGDENQNAFRRKQSRKEQAAAIKLQSCCRRKKAREGHKELIAGIIKVQSSFRGVVARAFVNSIFGLEKRAFLIKIHYARDLPISDLHSGEERRRREGGGE